TIAALGYSSYYFARRSAHELLRQVLAGKTALIVAQTERLMDAAAEQNQLNLNFAMKRPLTEDDFPRLAQFFADSMGVHPELTWLSLTLEHGGMIGADRSVVQEVRKNPRTGHLEWRDYNRGDYPRQAKSVSSGDAFTDPRHGEWFVTARRAGRMVWTETFIFPGDQGRPNLPGMTCAAPVYRADRPLGA